MILEVFSNLNDSMTVGCVAKESLQLPFMNSSSFDSHLQVQ